MEEQGRVRRLLEASCTVPSQVSSILMGGLSVRCGRFQITRSLPYSRNKASMTRRVTVQYSAGMQCTCKRHPATGDGFLVLRKLLGQVTLSPCGWTCATCDGSVNLNRRMQLLPLDCDLMGLATRNLKSGIVNRSTSVAGQLINYPSSD